MTIQKLLKGLVWTALVLVVIAVILRVALFRIWRVPSDDPQLSASIAPSLAPGDLVLLFHSKTPSFSDLVRCADPDEPQRWVIGRIVGESGDTVVIEQGRVSINGRQAPLEHACAKPVVTVNDPSSGSPVELRCDIENLGPDVHMRANKPSDINAPIKRTVDAGHVFLVSDNRYHAFDSRTYGPVPLETCDSRIFFRLFSAAGFADSDNRFELIR